MAVHNDVRRLISARCLSHEKARKVHSRDTVTQKARTTTVSNTVTRKARTGTAKRHRYAENARTISQIRTPAQHTVRMANHTARYGRRLSQTDCFACASARTVGGSSRERNAIAAGTNTISSTSPANGTTSGTKSSGLMRYKSTRRIMLFSSFGVAWFFHAKNKRSASRRTVFIHDHSLTKPMMNILQEIYCVGGCVFVSRCV